MATMSCPQCGGRFDSESSPALPFCSIRCQQIDLAAWLDEQRSLPVYRNPEDGEEPFEENGDEA